MPQVIFAPSALEDLKRLRAFLQTKNPAAAQRAAGAIIKSVDILADQPHIGRLVEDMEPAFREWVIDFGDSGYVALYRYSADSVTVLAIKHQREVGY
jgi:plasmid stabilization system protein ParE